MNKKAMTPETTMNIDNNQDNNGSDDAIENEVDALINSNIVTLDSPIKRGEHEIEALTIVAPRIEVMRKFSMLDLIRMETNTILNILPFVTKERLQKHEIEQIGMPDLLEIGVKIAAFFQKKG